VALVQIDTPVQTLAGSFTCASEISAVVSRTSSALQATRRLTTSTVQTEQMDALAIALGIGRETRLDR
jgi:hypothetical protein